MSKYDNKLQFQIGFNVDKTGLDTVKKSIQDIQNIKPVNFSGTEKELSQIKERAAQVQEALTKAFNVKLNSMNIDKFYSQLGLTDHKLDEIYADFAKIGSQGKAAFNQLASSLTTTNVQLRESAGLLQTMGTTMMNTVKWGIASSVMNTFTSSVQQAFQYVKGLDSALTDIRIVTGESRDQMAAFADQANRAASELGRSTMDYSKAALTFYQQGLNDEAVQARTESVLKAQNITGAGDEMADYLTAVWNGYKVANEQAELYVDKLAAVADSSASNMSQLAVAMSKVASTANLLGVPVDSLNAQIATIVATTRQAPESVGNALKTIYARINDITTGAEDAEVSLGNYTEKMAAVGVSVLDSNGKLRDTGDVIEEIGGKWESFSREQQIYLARTMAGQRQYNNLLALFENWGKYTDLVNVSLDSQGATMEKNSRYMESLEAHLNQLGTASERVKSAMIDSDSFKGLVDVGTGVTTVFANFIESIGGGGNALLALGSIATRVFSGTIAKEISDNITRLRANKEVYAEIQRVMAQTESQRANINSNESLYKDNPAYKEYLTNLQSMHKSWTILSQDERRAQEDRAESIRLLSEQQEAFKENKEKAQEFVKGVSKYQDLGKKGFTLSLAAQINGKVIPSLTEAKNSYLQFRQSLELETNQDIALQVLIDDLNKFGQAVKGKTQTEVEDLIKGLEQVGDQADYTTEQFDDLMLKIEQVFAATEGKIDFSKNIQAHTAQNKAQNDELQKTNRIFKSVNDNAKTAFNTQQVVKYIGVIGQVAAGISGIANVFKVIKNDSLSTGEKFLQIISNLAMSVPMLLNGFKSLSPIIAKVFTGITVGSSGATVSTILTTAATKGLSVALQEAGVSAASFWTALLGPFAIIAAALAALVVSFKLLADAWNADAIAAKNAREGAQQAKEAYGQTKQALEDLKTSLDNLNSSYDNIKQLTSGTQEWRDAVKQVNSQVLELIKNYPQLANHIENINGMLQLSEEGQEKALQLQEKTVEFAQVASIAAEQNARQANINDKATSLGRANAVTYTEEQRDFVTNVKTTETRKDWLDRQEVLKTVEAVSNLRNTFAQQGKLYNKSGEYTQEFITAIAESTGYAEDLIAQLLNDQAGMEALQQAILQDVAATKIETSTASEQYLQNQEWYQQLSDRDREVAAGLGATAFQSILDKATNDWLDYLAGTVSRGDQGKYLEFNDTSGQEILDAVSEAVGKTLSWDSNSIQGGDEERTFHFVDTQGNEVKYGADYIASIMATSQALNKLGNSAESTSSFLQSLSTIGDSNAQGIRQLISNGSFENLTKTQVENLDANSKEMQQFFKDNAEQAGFENENEFRDKFIELQNIALQGFNSLLDGLSTSVQNSFKGLKIDDNTTLAMQKEIAKSLQDAFNEGGKEGLQQLSDFYSKITDFEELENATDGLDFSTISAVKLAEELKNAGIATEFTTEQLEAYIRAKQQEGEAISPEDNYKAVHEIIDGLKRGDTITPEEAQALRSSGIELDGFFKHMADGSLKLKADAQDFYEYANNQSLEGFKEKIAQLQDQIARQQEFENTSQYSASKNQDDTEKAFSEFSSRAGKNDNQLLQEQIEFLNTINNLEEDEKQLLAEINNQQVDATTKTKEISEIVKEHRNDWQGNANAIKNNIEQLGIYEEELANANEIPLDEDVDEEQWEDLADYIEEYANTIEGVSEDVLNNAQAADQLAEAILRYDAALEEVLEKQEEWQAALTTGSDVQKIEAMNELQNVYSDLLDLPFEELSPDFTGSIQNLHLLQQAANGSEQAYNQLLITAGQDILAQVGLDASQFYIDRDAIYNSLYEIENQQWDDIEIGAQLNDDAFLNELTNMVQAAGMSAQQATDYLASMGIDAVVEENDVSTEETQQAIGYRAVQTPAQPFTAQVSYFTPDGQIKTGTVHYAAAGYTYEAVPIEDKAIKENKAFSLKVKSARKSSGGGFKFQKASHGGGNAGKSKSSGGGGGGGKGSTPRAASVAKLNTSKIQTKTKVADHNPYQQQEKSFQRQAKLLDKLKDKQKKLVNKDRLANLTKQNKVLAEQEKILRKELDISRNSNTQNSTANYAKRLRSLKQGFGSLFKLDKDGQISDLNALQANNAKRYNIIAKAAADTFEQEKAAYNDYIANVWNKYSTQEEQEAHKHEKQYWDERIKNAENDAKEQIKREEEAYKAREDLLKNYQKAWQADQKRREELLKIENEKYEHRIEQARIRVNLKIDTGELERDWLDFENKFIKKLDDKDFLGNAKASLKEISSYINSKEIATTQREIKTIQGQIDDMRKGKKSDRYGTNMAEAQKDLEEYMKKLQDDLMNIQDLVDDIKDNYLDAIDDAKDRMDDQISQYERINDLVEHNVKLTEMLYGDKAYDTLDKYYALQQKNDKKALSKLREQQLYWQQAMRQEVEGSDAWKKFKENLENTTDALNSKLEDMIDNLAKRFENQLNSAIEKINNKLTGGLGLDYLDEQWDFINDFDDNFLDTVNAKMGTEEVERLYKSAADGLAGNPRAQQRINNLLKDQLKILREKNELTQYDIDRAKALLEVEQARMALEDARNQKTKMRLRRDSQGNYTYQYVADEEKLGELQNALADAQNNLYNQDKEHYKENLNKLYDTYKDYLERRKDLQEEYRQAEVAKDQEEMARIKKRIQLLDSSYNKYYQGLLEDNNYLLNNYLSESFADSLSLDKAAYSAQDYMNIMKDNIPQVASNIQDLANKINGEGGLLNATKDAIEAMSNATTEYVNSTNEILATGGTSVGTIIDAVDAAGNALDKNIKQTEKYITANEKLIENCKLEINAMRELLSYLDRYMDKAIQADKLVESLRNAYNTAQTLNKSTLKADEIAVTDDKIDTTKGTNYTGKIAYTGNPAADAKAIKQQIDTLMAEYEKYLADMTIATFDTGGMTAGWGDAEGRLAFLHEKELVLNAADTQNILAAVESVREIANMMDIQTELSNLQANTGKMLSGIQSSGVLDQNVHIEANFPNVKEHTEIEQAFNNLVNMASMHASKYSN